MIAALLNERNELTVQYTRQRILAEADNYRFLSSETDNVIACIEIKNMPWYQMEVSHLSVAEAHEGRGHAKSLLCEAEHVARAQNARILQCTIREDNTRSRKLFEGFGFQCVGRFFNERSGNNVGVFQKILVPARSKREPVTIGKVVRGLLSPTRALFEFLKGRMSDRGTWFVLTWNWSFVLLAFATCIYLYFVPVSMARPSAVMCLYLWLVPFSRCNEVFFAFLDDALDRLRGKAPQTNLTPVDRLKLAMRSYLEIVADFAILYFLLIFDWFSPNLETIVDSLYFSGVTVATVGYGDIKPSHDFSKVFVLYEILVGLVLVVVTFATYLDQVSRRKA